MQQQQKMQRRVKRPIEKYDPCTTKPQLQKATNKNKYKILAAISLENNECEVFWASELKLNNRINMIKSKHKYTLDKHKTFFIINWRNTIESIHLIKENHIKIVSNTSENRKRALEKVNNYKQSLINSQSDSESQNESHNDSQNDSENYSQNESQNESQNDSKFKSEFEYCSNYKKCKTDCKLLKPTFHETVLLAMEKKEYNNDSKPGINPDIYYSVIWSLCAECTKDWPRQYYYSPNCDEFVKKNSTPDMKICRSLCKCGCCINLCKAHLKCK